MSSLHESTCPTPIMSSTNMSTLPLMTAMTSTSSTRTMTWKAKGMPVQPKFPWKYRNTRPFISRVDISRTISGRNLRRVKAARKSVFHMTTAPLPWWSADAMSMSQMASMPGWLRMSPNKSRQISFAAGEFRHGPVRAAFVVASRVRRPLCFPFFGAQELLISWRPTTLRAASGVRSTPHPASQAL